MPSKRSKESAFMYGPSVALFFEADRSSPEVIPPPRVNVWDQCLKFGEFRKENLQGQMTTTLFDETTVGQMMDYFRDHQNDLWMDSQHGVLRGKGQALCYHNALCMVARGQIVRFESKGKVKKPTIEDLRRPDGTLPENGLFAHRYQLTSLGLDEKEGIRVFKWISPLFDQPPHGYRLINITATNDPFLDGVALAYENDHEEGPMKKMKRMDESKPNPPLEEEDKLEQMMEAAGCTPEDSPDEKLKKMTAYAKKMSEELDKQEEDHALARKQMEEEHKAELKQAMNKRKMEEKKPASFEDPQGSSKEKPMSKTRFSEEEMEEEASKKPLSRKRFSEEETHDSPSKEKPMSKQRFSDENQEDQALEEELPPKESSKEQAMARKIYRELGLPSDREMARGKMRELHSLPDHVFALQRRLEKTEAERLEEKRLALRQEAADFANEALAQKRWRADHRGNEPATHKWLMQAYMRNPREAEDMLQPVGTFGLASRIAMTRYTEGGTPYGVDSRRTWQSAKSQGQGADLNKEALRIQAEQEKATGKPFGYERALAMAERRRPELLQAYTREVLHKENV